MSSNAWQHKTVITTNNGTESFTVEMGKDCAYLSGTKLGYHLTLQDVGRLARAFAAIEVELSARLAQARMNRNQMTLPL